jgi:hypothetical protein
VYSYKEIPNREMSVPCLSFTVMDQLTQMDVDDIELINKRLAEVSVLADDRLSEMETMQKQIEVQRLRLEETMSNLETLRRTLDEATNRSALLRADLETVGAALLAEAVRRDWCEEYDTFIGRVNEDLHSSFRLSPRPTLWAVEQMYTVTIRWQVEANNEEEAVDQARRDYNSIREGDVFTTDSLGENFACVTIGWDADGRSVDVWEER